MLFYFPQSEEVMYNTYDLGLTDPNSSPWLHGRKAHLFMVF